MVNQSKARFNLSLVKDKAGMGRVYSTKNALEQEIAIAFCHSTLHHFLRLWPCQHEGIESLSCQLTWIGGGERSGTTKVAGASCCLRPLVVTVESV